MLDKIPNNFLGLSPQFSNYKNSSIVIIPVPYEKTTSYCQGTKKGPQAIIEASKNVELYDLETQKEVYRLGIHTQKKLNFSQTSPAAGLQKIKDTISKIFQDKKFPVMLGGEHTITYPAFLAAQKYFNNLSLLHLDAHSDLRQQYEGNPFSHACVIRRIREKTKLTVSVGIRSLDIEEKKYTNKNRVCLFSDQGGPIPVKKILNKLSKNVYLTIDLDAFSPALIPAVGTPEPGGLEWYPALALLKELCRQKNLVGFDVVELCPRPWEINSDFIAAKLIYKILSYKFS